MKAGWLCRLALAAALAGAFCAYAEPGEEDELSLDPDYAAGKKAIETKDWSGAIRRLSSAALRDTRNADIQNYLGYAYRALQLNPRHRGAHEYLGEAYLMIGNLAKAEEHLVALKTICLIPCAEYGHLEKRLDEYRKRTAK